MRIIEKKKIDEGAFKANKSVKQSLYDLLLEIYNKKESEVAIATEFIKTLREVCYSVITSFEDESGSDLKILLNKIKKIKF